VQKEYAQAPGFEKWYALQQEDMGRDKLLILFKELRNTSIHQKPINPRIQSSFSIRDIFSMSSGSTIVLGYKNNGTYLQIRPQDRQQEQMSSRYLEF